MFLVSSSSGFSSSSSSRSSGSGSGIIFGFHPRFRYSSPREYISKEPIDLKSYLEHILTIYHNNWHKSTRLTPVRLSLMEDKTKSGKFKSGKTKLQVYVMLRVEPYAMPGWYHSVRIERKVEVPLLPGFVPDELLPNPSPLAWAREKFVQVMFGVNIFGGSLETQNTAEEVNSNEYPNHPNRVSSPRSETDIDAATTVPQVKDTVTWTHNERQSKELVRLDITSGIFFEILVMAQTIFDRYPQYGDSEIKDAEMTSESFDLGNALLTLCKQVYGPRCKRRVFTKVTSSKKMEETAGLTPGGDGGFDMEGLMKEYEKNSSNSWNKASEGVGRITAYLIRLWQMIQSFNDGK
ncbi:hypothetical protein H0H87_000944 [Tephrocybe sp. NHM501043]|nr:hypothetical protein H0H87_000944 [Tephrocybe sp. NHM501043]